MKKCHVLSGDLLIMKNKKDVFFIVISQKLTIEEKLVIHVYYSKSSLPNSHEYGGIISGTEDMTLNDLKKIIIESNLVPFISKETVFFIITL